MCIFIWISKCTTLQVHFQVYSQVHPLLYYQANPQGHLLLILVHSLKACPLTFTFSWVSHFASVCNFKCIFKSIFKSVLYTTSNAISNKCFWRPTHDFIVYFQVDYWLHLKYTMICTLRCIIYSAGIALYACVRNFRNCTSFQCVKRESLNF